MGIFNRKKKKKKGTSNKRIAYTPPVPTINSPGPKKLTVKRAKPLYEKEIDLRGDSASIWNLSEVPTDTVKVREYYKKSKEDRKIKNKYNKNASTVSNKRGGIVKDSWSNRANQRD
jgi:hypothetical protein